MYHFLESRQRNFLVSDQSFLHNGIKNPRIFFMKYISVWTYMLGHSESNTSDLFPGKIQQVQRA